MPAHSSLLFLRSNSTKRMLFVCLIGLVILCLIANDPVSTTVHIFASYTDYVWLHSSNRFTEQPLNGIVNPHNFPFLISEEHICTNKDVFLVVLIHTSPGHADLRKTQRETTLKGTTILGRSVIVLYLVGNSTQKSLNRRIETESSKYGDIIMEEFEDSYYNLTHKFMMGMRWVSTFCPNAQYVLKGDDDVYFNLYNIVQMLTRAPKTNFMSGYVYKYSKPYREEHSKWYISEKTYPNKYYPPFCRGYAYVMSGDLPPRLFHVAQQIPFFSLDDVFTGFCARRLNISPVYKLGFRGPGSDFLSFCSLNLSLAVHVGNRRSLAKLWQEQQDNPENTRCSRIAYYVASLF